MTAKVELNYDKLDALLQFKVSLAFCADYLGVSTDTIKRRLREDHDKTYTEYHNLKMQRTALKLQQKIIEEGLAGKMPALIFALKNMAGWSDQAQVQVQESGKLIVQFE